MIEPLTLQVRVQQLLASIRARFPVRVLLDAMLLSLLTAAVFGVAAYGFVRLFTEPRTHAVTGYVAAELGSLADAYDDLPAADRAAFVESVTARSQGRLVRDDLASRGHVPPGDSMEGEGLVADLVTQLAERFPPGRLAMTRDDAGLQLWFLLLASDGASQWVRMPVAQDATRWPLVSGVVLCLLLMAGAFASTYLAWRLRERVGGMHRALQRLRPDAVRLAAPTWARSRGADPPPSGDGFDWDPQDHLDALAGRLAQAARERAMLATAVASDLRYGLVQLAGSEPLLAAPEARPCLRRLEEQLAQLDRFAVSTGERPGPGGRRGPSHWRNFMVDLTTVAGLFTVAIALSAVVVTHGVFTARVQGALDMVQTVVSGIRATHDALPPARRPAYLAELQAHSGGALQEDDPARWPIEAPRLWILRQGLAQMRAAFPDLDMRTTPLPDSALWFRLGPSEGRDHWIRLSVPVVRSWHALVLAGLAVLSLAVAAVVVLQAQRRLVWFSLTIDSVDPGAPASPVHPDDTPEAGLLGLLRGIHEAAGGLARDHDREELALACLSSELGEALAALRGAIPHAAQAPGTADRLSAMAKRVAELDGFARRRQSSREPATDLNAELRVVRHLLADRGGPPVLWMPGGVPLADIPLPELRRLFFYLLEEVERHGDAPIVISTRLEASHIVLGITGHGHGPSAGGGPDDAVGLAVARRIVAASGGLLQLETGSDGGLQAQVWLRPARVA